MKLSKALILFAAVAFAIPCLARDYSLDAAMEAASKALPKGAPEKFALYDLRDGNEKPQKMLEFLRAGKGSAVFFAITSPNNESIRDVLARAMKAAKKERFDGLHLIIVGDTVAPEMFAPLLKDRGISVSYAAY